MPNDHHIAAIDHSNTMALLIVASSFPNDTTIDPIPNVLANLRCLIATLTNTDLVGIPEANITVSVDENRTKIEKRLRDIADKNKTQEVYAAGVLYGTWNFEFRRLSVIPRDERNQQKGFGDRGSQH